MKFKTLAISISVACCPTTLTTCILPLVIVPVLSQHSVSTRASVSIQYNSLTNVCCLANLIVPKASVILVRSIIPSGIIPIKAATVDVIALRQSTPLKKYCLANNNAPIGIMIIPIIFKILFRLSINSDFCFLATLTSFNILFT